MTQLVFCTCKNRKYQVNRHELHVTFYILWSIHNETLMYIHSVSLHVIYNTKIIIMTKSYYVDKIRKGLTIAS